MIAVQLEHTTENCVITILWHGPDNLAEAPVSNYTIAVNGTEVSHDSVQSIIEVNATDELEGTFSSVVSIPYCGRYLVALQAVNICGRESGVVTFTLFEETCLITQDMVCRAESIVTDTTTHYKTEANTNKNNADIPQGIYRYKN